MTPSILTTDLVKNCIDLYEWFDGIDIEDPEGELIGQRFPYEVEAKALCAECPALEWCRNKNWTEPYTIIAGKTPVERKIRRKK